MHRPPISTHAAPTQDLAWNQVHRDAHQHTMCARHAEVATQSATTPIAKGSGRATRFSIFTFDFHVFNARATRSHVADCRAKAGTGYAHGWPLRRSRADCGT